MVKGKRLDKWTVDDYTLLHKIVKWKPDKQTSCQKRPCKITAHRHWKNIAEASNRFGVDRATIRKSLEIYPDTPTAYAKKVFPQKIERFYETEAWQRIKGKKYEKDMEATLKKAWEILDRTDPLTWSKSHVDMLRTQFIEDKPNPLYIGVTNDVSPEHATSLRRAFKAMDHPLRVQLDKSLEQVPKRPAGARIDWYLEDDEIRLLIEKINLLDVLLYMRVGLECGARPDALAGKKKAKELMLTTDKIDYEKHCIKRYEGKKRRWVYPKFVDSTMDMVKRYVMDMRIPYGEPLFPYSPDYYSASLKEAGKKADIAKLMKKGAGAYILRHTFATQAGEHDVSLETVMEMGGWKDSKTLLDFYMRIKEAKIAREIRGELKENALDFASWVNQFAPVWDKRYLEIAHKTPKFPTAKREAMPQKKKTKRTFSWTAIKAITESEPTTDRGKRLRKYWRAIWEIHEKYPQKKYAEIKEIFTRGRKK